MKLFSTIAAFLLSLTALAAGRTEITGRVVLSDTTELPGDYVMVYAKQFGLGVLSDEDGNFSLKINVDSGESVMLEFSRIGYSILSKEVTLSGGTLSLGTLKLEMQPLMLMAAYVSPDGKSPAEVILAKLWQTSAQVRKRSFDYRTDIDYNIATHELPIVAEAAPGILLGAAKAFAGHQGYGPLFRYCLKNDDFSAHASMSRQVKNGVTNDFGKRFLGSDQNLPDGVKRNVLDVFQFIDFFDLMYGEGTSWGAKMTKKRKFKLTGTYEYGDKLVDVLKYSDRHNRASYVLHIVEEDWMILKIQVITKEGEVLRLESRDIGNGIYMPISFVLRPSATKVRAEQIPGLIEAVQRDKSIPKKTKEKMVKVLEEHKGADFNPYVAISGNARYRLI